MMEILLMAASAWAIWRRKDLRLTAVFEAGLAGVLYGIGYYVDAAACGFAALVAWNGDTWSAALVTDYRRVKRWLTFPIDWSGFAVTRGGFFDQWGFLVEPIRPRYGQDSAVLVAAGGFCAPIVYDPLAEDDRDAEMVECFGGFRWYRWRSWHPPYDSTVGGSLPLLSPQRGRIVFPPLPHLLDRFDRGLSS